MLEFGVVRDVVCTFMILLMSGREWTMNNDNTASSKLHTLVSGLIRKPLRKQLGRRRRGLSRKSDFYC